MPSKGLDQTLWHTVECKECQKEIGIFKGEGQVIGMCTKCYEALS